MKEQETINADKLWNRFYASGRIDDYLAYVGENIVYGDKKREDREWIGEESYAGFYSGDRYHIEADAYR